MPRQGVPRLALPRLPLPIACPGPRDTSLRCNGPLSRSVPGPVRSGISQEGICQVLDGADVMEVAALAGVHRATLHRWVARYLTGQLAGLADRSHRPHSCPRQVAEAVEVAVAEMRREHPRDSYRRLERPGPMQLWQMDIVGGIRLVSALTRELREAKVVTAVDDRGK